MFHGLSFFVYEMETLCSFSYPIDEPLDDPSDESLDEEGKSAARAARLEKRRLHLLIRKKQKKFAKKLAYLYSTKAVNDIHFKNAATKATWNQKKWTLADQKSWTIADKDKERKYRELYNKLARDPCDEKVGALPRNDILLTVEPKPFTEHIPFANRPLTPASIFNFFQTYFGRGNTFRLLLSRLNVMLNHPEMEVGFLPVLFRIGGAFYALRVLVDAINIIDKTFITELNSEELKKPILLVWLKRFISVALLDDKLLFRMVGNDIPWIIINVYGIVQTGGLVLILNLCGFSWDMAVDSLKGLWNSGKDYLLYRKLSNKVNKLKEKIQRLQLIEGDPRLVKLQTKIDCNLLQLKQLKKKMIWEIVDNLRIVITTGMVLVGMFLMAFPPTSAVGIVTLLGACLTVTASGINGAKAIWDTLKAVWDTTKMIYGKVKELWNWCFKPKPGPEPDQAPPGPGPETDNPEAPLLQPQSPVESPVAIRHAALAPLASTTFIVSTLAGGSSSDDSQVSGNETQTETDDFQEETVPTTDQEPAAVPTPVRFSEYDVLLPKQQTLFGAVQPVPDSPDMSETNENSHSTYTPFPSSTKDQGS